MLKRLTTAGLVLAFLMTLVGTAVSGPIGGGDSFRPLIQQLPADPPAKAKTLIGYTPLANRLTLEQGGVAVATVGRNGNHPGPNAPDTTSCYATNYYDLGTCFDFTHTRLGGTRTRQSMMFDITPGHTARVSGAWVYLYKSNGAGVTPVKASIELWTDAGGLPGTLVSRNLVAIPDGAVGSGAYVYLNFATTVDVAGTNFHIACGADTAAPVTDTLRYGSDDGANTVANACASAVPTLRSSVFTAGSGIWRRSTLVFVQPFDPNFDMEADYCESFTDCFVNSPFGGSIGGWLLPDNAWSTSLTMNGFGQRFVAAGPETLQVVHFIHGSAPLFGLPALTFYGAGGTNGITVEVWGDSSGSIDISAGPLATATVPGGIANMYPATGNAVAGFEDLAIPIGVVVNGPYHVTAKTTGNNPANGQLIPFLNGNSNPQGNGSVNFVAPDPNWRRFENSLTWTTDIGGGTPQQRGFLIELEMCKDEFNVCDNEVLYGPAEATGIFGIGSNQIAQRVTGLSVNRVEKVRFQIFDTTVATSLALVLRGDTAAPGAVLYSQPLVASSLAYFPGWNEVVIPGGYQVVGDFFVGLNDASGFPGNIGYLGNDDAPVNGGGYYFSSGASLWRPMSFAFAGYGNWMFEVEFCAIPFDERACGPDANWATRGHDFQRTAASGLALGDAYCDLNQNWTYEHPVQGINLGAGPAIYEGRVYCAFGNEYDIFDLATGALLDVINASDNTAILSGIRCVPTIAEVLDTNGVQQTYMYIAGGSGNSALCFDVDVLPAQLVWVARASNAWLGHTTIGGMRYGTYTRVDIGSDELISWGDDNGKVFMAYAKNGLPYAPFDGNAGGVSPYTPFATGAGVTVSGSTDGIRLFYATAPTSVNGDVFAINAADGTLAWRLSVTQGLKAAVLYPLGTGTETFNVGMVVDLANGVGHINSAATVTLGSQFPAEGVKYTMDLATGAATVPAVGSIRGSIGSSLYLDENTVLVTGASPWGSPVPVGGNLLGFNKATNGLNFAGADETYLTLGGQLFQCAGLLTCESGAPDFFISGTNGGFLRFHNADNGDMFFYRRIDYAAVFVGASNISRQSAIGVDTAGVTHFVTGAGFGSLFDYKKGADRARLQLLGGSFTQPVDFGAPADTIIAISDVYWNAGCTPLTVSLVANTTSNGTTNLLPRKEITTVRDGILDFASSMADRLTENGMLEKTGRGLQTSADVSDDIVATRNEMSQRVRGSQAALATPAFLNEQGVYTGNVFDPNTGSITTLPGDTSDLRVHVNGPLINRGPNSFFVVFDVHNDPDYYMNDNTLDPQVFVSLLGGCVLDTTHMTFGAASANLQVVWNTGRLADGDVANPHGFRIDGDNGTYFQGAYVYGVSRHRVALSVGDWGGGGEEEAWNSLLADPNFCDNDCRATLTTGVSLPAISSNGLAYTPITGNMVCKSYIDSVQNFDQGGGDWQWANGANPTGSAPFSNDSTMGLKVNHRVIGVVNAPAAAAVLLNGVSVNPLNQGTIDIMEFSTRYGQAVPGWKIWSLQDYDLGYDTAKLDFNASTAWSASVTGGTPGSAWGEIKIPFGCGYNGMKNVCAILADSIQFFQSGTDPRYLDSAYGWAGRPAGTAFGSPNLIQNPTSDQEAHFTIAEHDFTGTDTFKIAVVNFRATAGGDAKTYDWDAFANMYNKFAGFGRGDVNNDNVTNLSDIIYLADNINFGGKPGPIPFAHLGDVNADNVTNVADVTYLINYYFNYGPCPLGDFKI